MRCCLKTSSIVAFFASASLVLGAYAMQSDTGKEMPKETKKHAGFERLKKLVGDWEGTASGMGGPGHPANISLRLTAGGSTLVETEFCASDHEMMSVFHLDRGELVLTHYCHLANQPHMKAKSGKENDIAFEFVGGANIDPKTDMHMHAARYQIIDDDHFISTWTLFQNGAAAGEAKMDMKRKKANAEK